MWVGPLPNLCKHANSNLEPVVMKVSLSSGPFSEQEKSCTHFGEHAMLSYNFFRDL